MAVSLFKQKCQTPDNRIYVHNSLRAQSSLTVPMPTPIDLTDNKHNQIDAFVKSANKLDKSVKNAKNDKDDEQGKIGKRNPKCARCANHEPEPVPVKGHKRKCKYRDCTCELCALTVERRVLMAKTIREKRKLKEDTDDGSHVFIPPVFKKERSDDCSSETDKESGYSTNTEDNLKAKQLDQDRMVKEARKSFEHIWKLFEQIDSDELPEMVGKHVFEFLKDEIRQKIEIRKTVPKRRTSKQESTEQISSVKSEDSNNELNTSSPLASNKTPISSPINSSNHSSNISVESLADNYVNPLIRPTPYPIYPPFMHPYNLINGPNFQPFRFPPHVLNELLSSRQ